MTLSEYPYLKQQVIYHSGCCNSFDQVLATLKDIFKNEINSPRALEGIKSIGQLIKVLETRDVLSEENITPLEIIARQLKDPELLQKISEYERQPSPSYNQYVIQNNNVNSTVQQPKYNIINKSPGTQMSDVKMERILNTLCEEIGSFWRDLGRNLKVRERDIEDIEANNSRLFDRASELMKLYDKKKADPQRWFTHLCEALDNSRRKDLRRNLQEIMDMNI